MQVKNYAVRNNLYISKVMRLRAIFIYISFFLVGLSTSLFSTSPLPKTNKHSNVVIEPAKKIIYSLICHGDSDHTPLLKRKYKSKGIKEFHLFIETPDFGKFVFCSYRLNEFVKVFLSSLDNIYSFKRGPPPA